jgi:hypothetical protein
VGNFLDTTGAEKQHFTTAALFFSVHIYPRHPPPHSDNSPLGGRSFKIDVATLLCKGTVSRDWAGMKISIA